MIRSTKILFCCEDHGVEVTFPSIDELTEQSFIAPPTIRQLRAHAKAAGWRYSRGNDYCDACVELTRDSREANR
jgi:hypothetical protein